MNADTGPDGSTWEERMARRAAERARQLAEANGREEAAMAVGIHLHGTLTVCPCGAETGITTVAFPEDWVQPDPCLECGKPAARFGDSHPHRDVPRHARGCREHPETPRCAACGDVMIYGAILYGDGGWCHFQCAPGAVVIEGNRDRDH